jgi:hypothetical protein
MKNHEAFDPIKQYLALTQVTVKCNSIPWQFWFMEHIQQKLDQTSETLQDRLSAST